MKSTEVQTLGAYHCTPLLAACVYEYACAEIGHASLTCVCTCAYIIKRDALDLVEHGLAASVGTLWGRAGGS